MGQEAVCKIRFGDKTAEGRALLETSEVIFRSADLRLKIPFREIISLESDRGRLRVRFTEGVADFGLGKLAEKWAEKIRNPKSRIDKLGVKAGQRVGLAGIRDAELLRELTAKKAQTGDAAAGTDWDFVFFGVEVRRDLAALAAWRKRLTPAGAIWVVYPKGVAAVTEADVLAAGKKAALVDVKVVGFSTTHTALKMVIPVEKRAAEQPAKRPAKQKTA